MTKNDIVPTHLVVRAMRDNGYKNAAYAIAELMDNAIQAGATTVDLVCGDRLENAGARSTRRINQLAVLDNGCGMDEITLQMALQFGNGTRLDDYSGIGRFGMGLPNSSISQARRVEVWSWQDSIDSAKYTYLDVDEIERGDMRTVPDPQLKAVPERWLDHASPTGKSGTLVVWSKLDRIMWRTARAIRDNTEKLIGRMYRYFLDEDSVSIWLRTIDMDGSTMDGDDDAKEARPNDPLYLMSDTSCPEPYHDKPMFTQAGFEDSVFSIDFRGEVHEVIVRFAYAPKDVRRGDQAGSRPHGRHARDNMGVSIVRARRELDLDGAWTNPSEPRDRWWGVEVSFPPALDDLFGVTNNKQYARNFSDLAKKDLESEVPEGVTLGTHMDTLDADEDPRLPLLEIANHIQNNIQNLRRIIAAQGEGKRSRHKEAEPTETEERGTAAARKRIADGHKSETDAVEESTSPDDRAAAIKNVLLERGTPADEAEQIAAKIVERKAKYKVLKSTFSSPAFFDVQPKGGVILIYLNVDHPAYGHLLEVLEDGDLGDQSEEELKERLHRARAGLELLLMAWARYEDEATIARKDDVQESRWDWGKMARKFLAADV